MQTNLVRGFLSIVTGKAAILALTIIFHPLLVRLIGSSQYGEYTFVVSLLGVTMMVVNFGINDGIRKFVAENRSQPSWSDHVFGFYLRLGIALSVTAAVLYLAVDAAGLVEAILGARFTNYVIILAPLIVSRELYSIGRNSLMGQVWKTSRRRSTLRKNSYLQACPPPGFLRIRRDRRLDRAISRDYLRCSCRPLFRL
ncbi:lipopolysaccharide biosynthesis protein [Halosimplex aquaticum]